MKPTTRQSKILKNDEEIEGILSDTGSESETISDEEAPGDNESETSEDLNFELSDDLLVTDDDDDLYDILSALFTTDEGDNLCTALMGIKDTLDTQNKLLLKIAIAVTKKK